MRIGIVVFFTLLFLVACTTKEPRVILDINKTIVEAPKVAEKNVTNCITAFKELDIEEENIIENVFDDELYFEKDKVLGDKTQIVIKYLNNLDHGCPQWIASKTKNENSEKFLPSKEVLSLLAHAAIIDKLIKLYAPKGKSFIKLLAKHQRSLGEDVNKDLCYVERMEIEELKASKKHPNYQKKRE